VSGSEICGTCRYFAAGKTEAEVFSKVGGACRRYAPTGPAIVPSGGSWQIFPPMSSQQWCGDYRPAQDATAVSQRAVA
jgi:hypothetical protein